MKLTSPAFKHGEQMPTRFTCDGEHMNPPLEIAEVPAHARTLALLLDDPNAIEGVSPWLLWSVWNIHPHTSLIKAGHTPQGAVEGMNSAGTHGYLSPCPELGRHTYRFRLFALTKELSIDPDSTAEDIEEEMAGHIIEEAELHCTYHRR